MFPLFETERLVVRRLQSSDARNMHAVYGDLESVRWVGDGKPLTYDECVNWVEVTHRNYKLRGYGMNVAVLRETGATVGFGGIVHPNSQPEPEIKYALLKEYWGMGFATEFARGLIKHHNLSYGQKQIIATIHPQNTASERILKKIGMSFLETRKDTDGSETKVFGLEL